MEQGALWIILAVLMAGTANHLRGRIYKPLYLMMNIASSIMAILAIMYALGVDNLWG